MEVSYSPEQIERIAAILEGTDAPPDPIKNSFLRECLAGLLPRLAERSLISRELERSEPRPKAERDPLESSAYYARKLQQSLGELPEATVIRINSEMGKRILGEQQDLPGLIALARMPLCQLAMDTIGLLERSISKTLKDLPPVRSGRPEDEAWLFGFIKSLRRIYEDITGFRAGFTWCPDNNTCSGRYADFVKACVEPVWTQKSGSTLDNLIRKSSQIA